MSKTVTRVRPTAAAPTDVPTPKTEKEKKPTEAQRFHWMGEVLEVPEEDLPEVYAMLARYRDRAATLATARAAAFETEEELKKYMKGFEHLSVNGDRVVHWVWQGETKFDKRGLQRSHPELVEEYTTRTTDTKRVFNAKGVVGVD